MSECFERTLLRFCWAGMYSGICTACQLSVCLFGWNLSWLQDSESVHNGAKSALSLWAAYYITNLLSYSHNIQQYFMHINSSPIIPSHALCFFYPLFYFLLSVIPHSSATQRPNWVTPKGMQNKKRSKYTSLFFFPFWNCLVLYVALFPSTPPRVWGEYLYWCVSTEPQISFLNNTETPFIQTAF